MKKLIGMAVAILVLASSCILYFFRDTDLGGWEIAGEQYFPEEDVHGLDLVYHPTDGPLLVVEYMEDDSFTAVIRVYRYADAKWTVYTGDLSAEMTGGSVRAGFLSDGSLCVIPTEAPLEARVWDSGSWTSIDTTDLEAEVTDPWTKDVCFSGDGCMYLVVADYSVDYAASVWSFEGTTWTLLGTADQFPKADETWIGLDSDDYPLYLYAEYDINTDVYTFEMYQWDGSSAWNSLPALPSSVTAPYDCKSPLVSSDTAVYCIVRETVGEGYCNRLLEYSGGAWISLPYLPVTEDDSAAQHLIMDTADRPIIAVEDDGAFNEITVCRRQEDTWETLGIRGFSFGDAADNAVMALGGDGYLYLAYRAVGHENVASVMRYPLEE